jgi:hypothetical protein
MVDRTRKRQLFAALVVVDLIMAALTFRDLRLRDASRIRGSKRFWRIVTVVNPGNSLAYWVIGRKRTQPTGT